MATLTSGLGFVSVNGEGSLSWDLARSDSDGISLIVSNGWVITDDLLAIGRLLVGSVAFGGLIRRRGKASSCRLREADEREQSGPTLFH